MDRPQFIEFTVEPRLVTNDDPERSDVYRAMIDNHFLPLREIRSDGKTVQVRFDVPELIRARKGDQLLFLCFTSSYDKPDRDSERVLHSVQWR